MKAWIVISPVKPPADWGFQRDRWNKRYFRVTTSKLHGLQLVRDLNRLEPTKPPKLKPLNYLNLST